MKRVWGFVLLTACVLLPRDAAADAPPPGANALCPVKTDQAANAAHFVEHGGKRVYFCCEKCAAKFSAYPAPYLAGLATAGGSPTTPAAAKADPPSAPAGDRDREAVPTPPAAAAPARRGLEPPPTPAAAAPASRGPKPPPTPAAAQPSAKHRHERGSRVWALLGRLRPLAVHFPIALLLVAAAIEVWRLSKRMPVPTKTGTFCLVVGAAGAVVAAALGWVPVSVGGIGGLTARLLAVHRWLGVGVAVVSVGAAALALTLRRTDRRALSYAHAACVALCAVAVIAWARTGERLATEERLAAAAPPAPRSPPPTAASPREAGERIEWPDPSGATGMWVEPNAPTASPAPPAPAAAASTAANPGAVDFVRDIQTIFKTTCYKCHGPEKQKAALRLDSKPLALQGGESGASILPGKGAESLLVQRLRGIGDKDRMPKEGKALSEEKIALIARWIDQGAVWPDSASVAGAKISKHWSYVKPARPEVPSPRSKVQSPSPTSDLGHRTSDAATGWLRNPIDHFILARLEKEGLSPSPEAPRESLIRRVTLDLTGLPPTPEEADAFLADASPDAYEKVVERLLASPAYGERWARPWLDLARYADTNGLEKDGRRTNWRYRDWVIDAFNRDLPFDRFTIEQIAGDMLPGATQDQIIATGFHRNTMINEEGGVDGDEAHWEALVDRVGATGTIWLGSTVACSQCHNHKFDPFKQKEFYQFLAFFEHTELGTRPNGTVFVHYETTLELPTPEQAAKRTELQAQIAKLEPILNTPTPELETAQVKWERENLAARARWTPLAPASLAASGGSVLAVGENHVVTASGPNPDQEVYTITAKTPLHSITGVRLELLVHPSLPHNGPGRDMNGDFALTAFEVEAAPLVPSPEPTPGGADGAARGGEPPAGAPPADGGRPAGVKLARAVADLTRPDTDPANLISGKPGTTGWTTELLNDAARADRVVIFSSEKPVGFPAGAALTIRIKQELPGAAGKNLGRFRLSVTGSEHPANTITQAQLYPLLEVPPEKRTDAQKNDLAAKYRAVAPVLEPTRRKIAELRQQIAALGIVTTLVLNERPAHERPSAHLRIRGTFTNPGEKVYADVPAFLPPLPPDAMPNRLGLAKWLVDENNPLVARVTVNRFWEALFGRGIVETAEDFGSQGSPPTHPELLDWLAVEFMNPTWEAEKFKPSPWSMKALLRLIVTSATYRRSSRATPELIEKDPYNRLFARGPRFRMDAEMVRDAALASSGLLSRKMGGPSVFPYQPEGIWNVPYNDERWTMSAGEDRYRRSLYTFWRRSAPYPMFASFDAPSREFCCVRRVRTNTPLQAMNLMNDPAFLEAARSLARRALREAAEDDPRAIATRAFRLCLARAPKPAELDRILALYVKELETYTQDPKAAQAILKEAEQKPAPPPKRKERKRAAAATPVPAPVPAAAPAAPPAPAATTAAPASPAKGAESAASGSAAAPAQPAPDALDPEDAAELAAWTMTASAIMNLDETVTKE